jgi:hypothetical protein
LIKPSVAASRLQNLLSWASQGSQSLALGLALAAASQLIDWFISLLRLFGQSRGGSKTVSVNLRLKPVVNWTIVET